MPRAILKAAKLACRVLANNIQTLSRRHPSRDQLLADKIHHGAPDKSCEFNVVIIL